MSTIKYYYARQDYYKGESKRRYDENKEEILKKQKEKYSANKDEINRKNKERLKNDPEHKQRKKDNDKRYREKNKEKIKERARQRLLDDPEFAERKRRLNRESSARNKDTTKKYRQTDKYKMSDTNSRNKRRAVKGDGTIPQRIDYKFTGALTDLLNGQKWMCNSCGVDLNKGKHLDHYIPLSKGGEHSIKNVQWLCPDCNRDKKAILPSSPLVFHLNL